MDFFSSGSEGVTGLCRWQLRRARSQFLFQSTKISSQEHWLPSFGKANWNALYFSDSSSLGAPKAGALPETHHNFGGRRSVGAFSPSAFFLSQSHGEHGGVSGFQRVSIFILPPPKPVEGGAPSPPTSAAQPPPSPRKRRLRRLNLGTPTARRPFIHEKRSRAVRCFFLPFSTRPLCRNLFYLPIPKKIAHSPCHAFMRTDRLCSRSSSGSAGFWLERNFARYEKHFPKIQHRFLWGEDPA